MKLLNGIANVLWFLFGGLISALAWMVLGLIWYITIIGIPIGRQCLKFSDLALAPFGKEIIYREGSGKYMLNLIWLIFLGLPMGLFYAALGCVLCVTLIGIPLGLQSFKFAKLTLMPFGAEIVKRDRYDS